MGARRKFLAALILVFGLITGTMGLASPSLAADGVCGGVGDCYDDPPPPPPSNVDEDCDGIDDNTGEPISRANGVCGGVGG